MSGISSQSNQASPVTRRPLPFGLTQGGFTLLELLGVILVLAILAGLTFGALRSGGDRAQVSRTQAELSVLAQILERYKSHYGSYPVIYEASETTAGANLYSALIGRIGPTGNVISPPGRNFLADFDFELVNPDNPNAPGNYLIDPWQQPYLYFYRSDPAWSRPGFFLYSSGPDQAHLRPSLSGEYDSRAEVNLDNVFP